MTPQTLKLFETIPIRIAIVDAHMGTMLIAVGSIAYFKEAGYIPMVVRVNCDRPKDEPMEAV